MLVGRDPELAVLRERLARAREGASSCLVISGEAGVGKSRLLDEIAQAAAGVPLLRTTCVSAEAGLPFAALSDLLRPVLQHLPDLPSEYQEALRAALAPGPPISDTRCPVALALLGLLSAVATDAGVLVLVDDAQWLDQASADALLMLAHRLDAEGVLLVLAAGDGEGEATRLADLPRLPLGGLRPAEAQALLRAAAGQPAAEDVLQRLLAGAAGNPLALLHVARTLTTGQWRGRDPLPAPLPVGPRLQEAYAARVSDLPSRTRLALLLAATATGRRDVVRAAAARLGLSNADLDAAVSAGLVAVERGQVVFPSPLARAALAQSAPLPEQRAMHRALADALEPGADAWTLERRAAHLVAATLVPDEGVAEVIEAAAGSAEQRRAAGTAAELYRCAARLSTCSKARVRRLLASARAAVPAGRPQEAVAALDETTALL